MNNSISLCMIVKNEEKFLPRCLESVRDYVDEIIIVDTGSTDSTVEIAKRYNARIYHHPWENSFSKARNYSLKYATCDWVLWLDADEEVDKDDVCKLTDVIKNNDVNAFFLPMFNKPVGGKNVSVFNAIKMFRNHQGFHFEGIVHNRLKYSGATKNVNIRLYHYGYNLDDEQKEKKFIRRSTLLREQIRNDPHNPLPHHYLAVAYLNSEKYDECIREALEAIDLFEKQNSVAIITLITYHTASVAFYRKGDLCKAEKYALKALDFYPDYMDAYCILSTVYLRQKEYSKCIAVTEKYLMLLKSITSNPAAALTIPYNLQGSLGALSRLAILNFEQGKEHEGIKALKRAIDSADYEWGPYLALGDYFLGMKDLDLAERFLKEGHKYSTDNKEVLFALGRLNYLRNDYKKAEALYKKVLEIDPNYIDVLKGMGTLCLDTKRFGEARLFLYKVLRKIKDVEVYNNLGCLEDKEGFYKKAISFFRKALELGPENKVIINNINNIQEKLTKERENEGFSKPKDASISLCMIVKDEEKFLPGCLDSVKGFVDEIIIVDTGSTDNTVEIAKKYNAKVYHHPWENSFSKARNYSLKYATCDWVLWLDADEEIEKNDAHKLREVIKDPVGCETADRVNVILAPMFDRHIGDNKNLTVFNSEKIFRNHIGIYFEGIVHNSLKYSGQTKNSNIKIYHYGYTQGEEQMERKFTRTTTLLKEQIRNGPENPVPHHYLAISYLDRKKHDECIGEALEAIRLYELQNNDAQTRLLSYYTASVAFYRKEDLCNAETYALKALDFYPDYLDAYCILSSIYFRQKEHDKCIKVARKYLSLLESIKEDPATALVIAYNTLQHAWLVHIRIATINFIQGKEDEGIQALKSAINCVENKWGPYLSVGKYFFEQSDYEMAERFLKDGLVFDSKNKNILYYLSEIHEKKGEMDRAILQLKNIIKDHPDEIPVQYRLGLLQMKGNRFDEAINAFKSVINKQPHHMGALFSLAAVYESAGDVTNAKYTYNDILTIGPENPEALVKMGYLHIDNANFVEAKGCFLNTIKLDKYLIDAFLALSKINISLSDLNGCVMNCDKLLKRLNLPGNVTIDSMSDLSDLYVNIGNALMGRQNERLAKFSFEISALLNPGALVEESQHENMLEVIDT